MTDMIIEPNGNIHPGQSHLIGRCQICGGNILYGTNRAVGCEGDSAKLCHDDCKAHRDSGERRRTFVTLLAAAGVLREG